VPATNPSATYAAATGLLIKAQLTAVIPVLRKLALFARMAGRPVTTDLVWLHDFSTAALSHSVEV